MIVNNLRADYRLAGDDAYTTLLLDDEFVDPMGPEALVSEKLGLLPRRLLMHLKVELEEALHEVHEAIAKS